MNQKQTLIEILKKSLHAVNGRDRISNWLQTNQSTFDYVIAIGKAASSMMLGVLDVQVEKIQKGLLITKPGHIDESLKQLGSLQLIESAHPILDESSLYAGDQLIKFLHRVPEDAQLLFLISGGTSSLVESPVDAINLDELKEINQYLLASGFDIVTINAWRKQFSKIKAGGLLNHIKTDQVTQLLISDVPQNDVQVIGSGLLVRQPDLKPPEDRFLDSYRNKTVAPVNEANVIVQSEIIASLEGAKSAAREAAIGAGYKVFVHDEFLQGDALCCGKQLAEYLIQQPPGIHVWGGETTVVLPPESGRGGRNQSLALSAAIHLQGHSNIYLLAAGSDGSDGPTNDAGACIDGKTVSRAQQFGWNALVELNIANAGEVLESSGDLLVTGPTGTNVMDLVIALVE